MLSVSCYSKKLQSIQSKLRELIALMDLTYIYHRINLEKKKSILILTMKITLGYENYQYPETKNFLIKKFDIKIS